MSAEGASFYRKEEEGGGGGGGGEGWSEKKLPLEFVWILTP